MPGAADRPSWSGSAEDLEGWDVFSATLREGSIQTTFQVDATAHSDPMEAERRFRGQVVTVLRRWLERGSPGEADSEAFKLLVAKAPGKPTRIASYARPTPDGCERVPTLELARRVLREVFGVRDLPSPTEEAVYVVDLSLPESAGRYQLFGPATSREEDRTRVLRGILDAVLRRTSADFPIEAGRRLQVRSLSNGKVIVSFPFPPRREPGAPGVLGALPDLWSAAVQDLRNRLSV